MRSVVDLFSFLSFLLKHGALVHGTSHTYLSYLLYFLSGLDQEY